MTAPLWAPDGPNLVIEGDNLSVTSELPDASFTLIYLDPPFNTGREQVRQTLDSRIAEINDLLPGIGNAGLRFALSESARRAAAQQLEPERRIEDRLAGGHAFGSVEAISALNRAAAGGTKDSHETAKNTKEAVAELKTIANQVKRIGKADSLVAGPSVP